MNDEDDDVYAVEEASGAITNCECCWCRELRLQDEERITYTAYDLAVAWMHGRSDREEAVR